MYYIYIYHPRRKPTDLYDNKTFGFSRARVYTCTLYIILFSLYKYDIRPCIHGGDFLTRDPTTTTISCAFIYIQVILAYDATRDIDAASKCNHISRRLVHGARARYKIYIINIFIPREGGLWVYIQARDNLSLYISRR